MERLDLAPEGDDSAQNAANGSQEDENANEDQKAEDPRELDHDDILLNASYASLLGLLASKAQLPMPVSAYYAKHLLAAISRASRRTVRSWFVSRGVKKEIDAAGGEDASSMAAGGAFDSRETKLAVMDLFIEPHYVSKLMRLDEDAVAAATAKTEERRGTGFLLPDQDGMTCSDLRLHR